MTNTDWRALIRDKKWPDPNFISAVPIALANKMAKEIDRLRKENDQLWKENDQLWKKNDRLGKVVAALEENVAEQLNDER